MGNEIPTRKDFRIIITGSAEYDAEWQAETDKEKDVIDFQQVANVFFRMHRAELEKMFNDLSPIRGHSSYSRNFNVRGVDVEA